MVSEWWEVYILSNQGFGHTHSLVGESLNEGSVVQVPDVLEQSSCQNPWKIPGEYFLQFSVYLFPFPFPFPTHCNLSSERATCSSSMFVQNLHSHLHLSPPLLQRSCCSIPGPALAYLATTSFVPSPSRSHLPKGTDCQISQVSWYAELRSFFFLFSFLVLDLIICKSKGREQRNVLP